MEFQILKDLSDDLEDTRYRNKFLRSNLRKSIRDNRLKDAKKLFLLLEDGESIQKEIEKIINDYAKKN
jgi:hypothetical protein